VPQDTAGGARAHEGQGIPALTLVETEPMLARVRSGPMNSSSPALVSLPGAPRSNHGWSYVALALFLIGAWIRIALPPVHSRTPDERVYALFAAGFAQEGFSRYPQVVQVFIHDPRLLDGPSPLRVGYLALLASAVWVTGDPSPSTGTLLSLAASLATLGLTGWIALRFLPTGSAPLALLFLVASPLDLAMARRAWQDGVFAFVTLGMLAAVLLHQRRPSMGTVSVCFALGFFAILVKETGALVLAIASAQIAWSEWRAGRPRFAGFVALAAALVFATAFALLVALCGGLSPFRQLMALTQAARDASGYTRQYQSGSALNYVFGLGVLDPLPWALAAITALGMMLWPAARRVIEGRTDGDRGHGLSPPMVLSGFMVAFALAMAVYPVRNLRFLAPLFAPAALLAAAGMHAGLAAAVARLPRGATRVAFVAAIVVAASSATLDYARFRELFVHRDIPDLATPWFVPRR
jgi:hypothetical protein